MKRGRRASSNIFRLGTSLIYLLHSVLTLTAVDLYSDFENHNAGWSNLWDIDNSNLWDRGKPSAALVDLIEERRELFSAFTAEGKRKKALVPVSSLASL